MFLHGLQKQYLENGYFFKLARTQLALNDAISLKMEAVSLCKAS